VWILNLGFPLVCNEDQHESQASAVIIQVHLWRIPQIKSYCLWHIDRVFKIVRQESPVKSGCHLTVLKHFWIKPCTSWEGLTLADLSSDIWLPYPSVFTHGKGPVCWRDLAGEYEWRLAQEVEEDIEERSRSVMCTWVVRCTSESGLSTRGLHFGLLWNGIPEPNRISELVGET
jgi:hypothetical protein